MNVVDTNLLVYSHRRDSAFHGRAREVLREHVEGDQAWGLPWPCVHEFLSVVTNPKVFKEPSPLRSALGEVEGWMGSPGVVLLAEAEGYWNVLRSLLEAGRIHGGKVHDARIAALALLYRASVLLSADRDFSRFPSLRLRNPL